MKINYPIWADTIAKKYAFLTLMEEILLIIYNQGGTKYREGNITNEEWIDFQKKWCAPREKLIQNAKAAIRTAWKNKQEQDLPDWAKPRNVFTE